MYIYICIHACAGLAARGLLAGALVAATRCPFFFGMRMFLWPLNTRFSNFMGFFSGNNQHLNQP